MLRASKPHTQLRFGSLEVEERIGARRLLRIGLTMLGVSSIVWLTTMYAISRKPNYALSPAAEIFTMTITILLWPAATLGFVALFCWAVVKIVETIHPPGP
jgi:hypothetical protein